VEAVFIDIGADGRDLGDLMPHRVGVVSLERCTTASAVRRLHLEGLSELLGRDKLAGVTLVTGLAAPLPPGRWGRRTPLDLHGGGIRRGWFRGVGGVLVEPGLQVSDPLLQRDDDGQDGRLGFRRYRIPERFGDRRMRAHTGDSTSLLYKMFESVNAHVERIN
jgi:hypothetical protein